MSAVVIRHRDGTMCGSMCHQCTEAMLSEVQRLRAVLAAAKAVQYEGGFATVCGYCGALIASPEPDEYEPCAGNCLGRALREAIQRCEEWT